MPLCLCNSLFKQNSNDPPVGYLVVIVGTTAAIFWRKRSQDRRSGRRLPSKTLPLSWY